MSLYSNWLGAKEIRRARGEGWPPYSPWKLLWFAVWGHQYDTRREG